MTDTISDSYELVASYTVNRRQALGIATVAGVGFGVANAYWQPVSFTLDLGLLLSILAALPAVTAFHELVHALPAWAWGYKARFSIKPPLVYVTFDELIPVRRLRFIALLPLVVVTATCIALMHVEILRRGAYVALMINVIGAIGDLSIVWWLRPFDRACLVRDTKSGGEVYRARTRTE